MWVERLDAQAVTGKSKVTECRNHLKLSTEIHGPPKVPCRERAPHKGHSCGATEASRRMAAKEHDGR